jgi:hypothetical protein
MSRSAQGSSCPRPTAGGAWLGTKLQKASFALQGWAMQARIMAHAQPGGRERSMSLAQMGREVVP